ncbi:calcium-binding tyrosine phosphorylation-regulated protein isoform X1 [Mixophyes fleayi]|uniref:calcium-binding tyrosine phosphorylation-regulated protein isoform X1 n=1 Tax=Mixophyes fleayi TaxID=3061075 RepID=UPI003F4E0F00
MMPTKPRLLVPYGLKTLLEGLSRAVMVTQPGNIAHFASFYFTELMQYRKVNPTLDIKDLVKEFQSQQVNTWAKFGTGEDAKPETPNHLITETEATSQIVESMNQDSIAGQDALITEVLKHPLHWEISNPKKGPGQEVIGHKESERYQQEEQTSPGVDVSPKQSADADLNATMRLNNVLSTAQSHTSQNIGERAPAVPSKTLLMTDKMEPKTSHEQACTTATVGQVLLDTQYSQPSSVLSDTQTKGASPYFEALSPERIISKLQIPVNISGPVDKIVSNTLQYLPVEADVLTHPDPAARLLTDPKSAIFTAKQAVSSQLFNNVRETIAPNQTPLQFEKKSEAKENPQTPKMSSSPLYNIHLAGSNPVDENLYEPAYMPAKDACTPNTILYNTTSTTELKMGFAEQASAYYGTRTENRVTPHLPEHAKATSMVSSQDPMQHASAAGQFGSLYVEPIPQNIYFPSQTGSKQKGLYKKSSSPSVQQHSASSMNEYGKYLLSQISIRSNSPVQVNTPGFSDDSSQSAIPESYERTDATQWNVMDSKSEKEPENLWTLHPLSDLNQHKISLEKAQQRRNVFINNNGEPYKSGHLDQSMNSQYAQVTEQVSRRSKYVEPHLYPCMERSPPSSVQPVFNTSPAYMVAEEAKEVVNTPPYIMVGTSVQEPQESNKQNLLRFTTKPSSLPVTTDSSTQTEDQMQDACALKAPSYVSMSVDMDELYRLCASHSIAQFAEASPVPSYALHRSIAAKAAAATRCPSINEVMNPPKFSNPRTDQQIGTDGGYGRPYEALKPDKIPAVLKVPEETRKS